MFVHAVTYPGVRYSEPLHPLLSIMIAAAVSERVRALQDHYQQAPTPVEEVSGKEFAKWPFEA
jgi:hypothetical protein